MANIVPSQFGSIMKVQPGDPGAGSNYNFSVAVPGRFIITAFTFTFNAAVTVANRGVEIRIESGGDLYSLQHTKRTSITASQTVEFSAYHGAESSFVPAWGFFVLPMPLQIMLSATFSFITVTENLQVGDTYTDCTIWGMRWLEPTD